MSHNHDHGHSAPVDFTSAFAIGIVLNTAFVLIEGFYGYMANSLALVADAGHNLSDVAGLILAWGAAWLSKKKPSQQYTYGLRSSSILAALFNALFLLFALGGIAWEAIQRLTQPESVSSVTVIVVASVGILINGLTALLFASGRNGDLNIRGAFMHMAADALVSLGVVVAGIAMFYTRWNWLDPVLSLVITVIILYGTWGLLKDSINLAIAAVPRNVNPEKVRNYLAKLPGVASLHDLHIWAMSTTETALTAHLIIPDGHPGDKFLENTAHELEHDFEIHHVTLQIEVSLQGRCRLAPDHVV